MTIGIGLKNHAYTPEAYAYAKHLENHNINVQLVNEIDLNPNNDLNIYFMGIRPFWVKEQGSAIEVHEYQSLSTAPYAKFKDRIKKTINKKPAGRIFLNNIVKEEIGFNDNQPFIYRDMGVDDSLFQKPNENPEFDIVYCGSVNGRAGLLDEIERLLNLGMKILVIGEITDLVKDRFSQYSNITFTGRVTRNELPELYSNCRMGLNYTPDIYPFNIQTSTKTLEYLASGLKVVSNKYFWAEKFFEENNVSVLWLDDFKKETDFEFKPTEYDFIKKYSWSSILEKSNLIEFLMKLKA